MNPVFAAPYARAYDLLYADKDYSAECDIIAELVGRFAVGAASRVLDLGCGTGNHAIPLSARGFEVTGVERSVDMLAEARRKVAQAAIGDRIALHQGDIRDVHLDAAPFDLALMMFAVLGYQLSNADVRAALRAARAHLRDDGLLIFDVWYGPGVLSDRPGQRIRVAKSGNEEIVRVTDTELDTRRHTCDVRFNLWRMTAGELAEKTEEMHSMRYFFPMELEAFLDEADFDLLALRRFPQIEQEPDSMTWNVIVVGRARVAVPQAG